jgi:hypothetical protein
MNQKIKRVCAITVIGLVGFFFGSACIPEPTETPKQDPGPILTSVVETVVAETTKLAINRANKSEGQNSSEYLEAINTQTASDEPYKEHNFDIKPGIDQAMLVSQIPDRNKIFTPGSQFEFIWNIKNTGTNAWNNNYKVVFFSGDRIGAGLPLQYRLAGVVKPGETTQITIKAITGSTQGEFKTIWVLTNEQGRYFFPLNGRIKVGNISKP